MENDTIQCIIISEDVHYKTKVQTFLNNTTDTEVIVTNTLMEALTYLNDKPPFKLLIRKHNKPLDEEELENCRRVVERDMNFRIVVFQKEHNHITQLLNANSLRYMQYEKGLFAKMKIKSVLKRLSGK